MRQSISKCFVCPWKLVPSMFRSSTKEEGWKEARDLVTSIWAIEAQNSGSKHWYSASEEEREGGAKKDAESSDGSVNDGIESLKAFNWKEEFVEKNKPRVGAPRRRIQLWGWIK